MNPDRDTDRDTATDHAAGAAVWTMPAVLLATCGGLGRVPVAPGTAGSVLGVPLAVATGLVATSVAGADGPRAMTAAIEACLIAAVCLIGVPVSGRAARLLGRGKDPGAVVFDEMAAVPLVLLPVPPAERSPACLAAAFLLFRIFDIAKPPPCRWLERLPAGWGIMADDWAAAAWAAACLMLAHGFGLV